MEVTVKFTLLTRISSGELLLLQETNASITSARADRRKVMHFLID
jgi:hypothetical protein